MRKLFFIIVNYFVLCFSINLNGQFHYDKTKVSQQTQEYIEYISNVGYYSLLGINTGQFEMDFTDDSLFKSLPIIDIRYLTKHTNPYIRAYAFRYFNEKASPDQSLVLLKEHFFDSIKIQEGSYCLTDERAVFDVMYREYKNTEKLKDTPFSKYLYTIDSFVIKNISKNYYNAIDYAILNIGDIDFFYHDIKNLAKNNYPSAIIGLAKYKRDSDIEIILNSTPNLNYYDQDDYRPGGYSQDNVILKAIENFSNKKFEEFLLLSTNKLLNEDKKIDFGIICNSISAQKSDFSITQLLRLYDKAKLYYNSELIFEKCNIVSLAEALYKNLNPKFEKLSISIAKDYSLIDNHFINYFKNRKPELVDNLCKQYIEMQICKRKIQDDTTFSSTCDIIYSDQNLIYSWLIERDLTYLKNKLQEAISLKNKEFKHELYGLFIEKGVLNNENKIFSEINKDLKNGLELFYIGHFYRKCSSEFKRNLKNYLGSKGHDVSMFFDGW